ncbi:UNVERIFIED_CONTAM: hypothetical protein RMT77_007101 [Armadillidium vulgare]
MASARSTADMSDMEVKRLNNAIRRRKLLRNRVTKSICESNKILNNSHPNLGTLIAHFNNLRGIETELNKVNAIIQQSLNIEALSMDDEECFRYYMTIIFQTVHINLKLDKLKGDFTFNLASKVSRDPEILNPSTEQLDWFHKKTHVASTTHIKSLSDRDCLIKTRSFIIRPYILFSDFREFRHRI